MIVREGERIGPEHLIKLSAENKLLEGKDTLKRVPGMTALIAIFLAAIICLRVNKIQVPGDDSQHLLFAVITLILLFLFTWAYNFIAEEVARGFHSLNYKSLLFAMPCRLRINAYSRVSGHEHGRDLLSCYLHPCLSGYPGR